MTRDEAATLLADIPDVKAIEVASLKPGDVLIMQFDGAISQETARHLEGAIKSIWPDNKVLVLGDGLQMRIVRGGNDD